MKLTKALSIKPADLSRPFMLGQVKTVVTGANMTEWKSKVFELTGCELELRGSDYYAVDAVGEVPVELEVLYNVYI